MTEAEAHGEGAYNVGESILHHILDAPVWQIQVAGMDLTITRHVLMMWVASAFLLVVLTLAARKTKEEVPRGSRSLFEMFILFIRDEVARKSMGHDGDRYLGYLLTTFFFILTCNLLGLIPGMATPTGNISVTAALALMAFVMIQLGGVREHGVAGHVKNLVPHGVPLWLVPIMLLVETLSTFIKPFALCIRLFANMMAGHVVILALISLIFILKIVWVAPISVGFALFIYVLEILVAFIQAYIFTMLTAQFIGMTVHPAH